MFRDTLETLYALRDDDTPLVHCDDRVAAGEVIATGSGSPVIVPYAATLHLSAEAAADAVARRNGADCQAGASLGARRVGLVTRGVSAPADGTALSLPKSGALAIRKETTAYEHRARYGGIVRDIREDAIIISSDVARCVYAFADAMHDAGPLQIEPALLDAATAEETIAHVPQAASSTVIAHIGDAAHLKTVLRSFHGTLLVGSVTELVAWALLERLQTPETRRTKGPVIIVLYGVSDAERGRRAVASLRHFHGATVILDRFTQTVTFIPSGGLPTGGEASQLSGFGSRVERRDPANYGAPCDTHGAPSVAQTSTGVRALCALSDGGSSGEQRVPVQNLQQIEAAKG